MKSYIKPLVLSGAVAALCGTTQAQTPVSGWGYDANAGTSLSEGAPGNFTITGQPTGNTVWRGDFSAITLGVGDTITMSGSLNFTSGNFAGGLFRLGLLDYTAPGTLSGTTWSGASTSALGYMWGIPTGGAGIGGSNPSEITGHNGGGAWYSSNNGYSVPGGLNNNAANATANNYLFSLSYTLTSATSMQINYSFSDTAAGGSYSEIGTAIDNGLNAGNVATKTFNAVGFFVNGSDTLGSPLAFSNVSITPEPASIALLGLGLAGLVIRRHRA